MAEGQSSVGGGGMGSPQTLFPTPATGQPDNSFFSQFGGNRNQGGGVKMSFLAPIITSLLGGVIGAVGSKDKKKGFKKFYSFLPNPQISLFNGFSILHRANIKMKVLN